MTPARFLDRRWLWLTVPLFPLVIGGLLMRHSGVATAIWGQNLAAGLLFTLICVGLRWGAPRPVDRRWWGLAAAVAVGLLLATFADAGLAGVHRWVRLGPVRLHAGGVCLPLLILALGKFSSLPGSEFAGWFAPFLSVGVLALLVCQPDAAQATAFAGALLVLVCFGRQPAWVTRSVALAVVVCVVWAWKRPDPLLPVPYVEGIVGLAAQRGAVWQVASLASLALLPWPFLSARQADGKASPEGVSLGVYVCLSLIVPWFAPFPVPLLGFGLAPIAGYFIALAWLMTRQPDAAPSRANPRP